MTIRNDSDDPDSEETQLSDRGLEQHLADSIGEVTETQLAQCITAGYSRPPVASGKDPSLTLPLDESTEAETLADVLRSTAQKPPRDLHLLGQGGMGEVWGAQQSALLREVAIKVPRADVLAMMDPVQQDKLVGAFLREARVSAILEHPAMVPVHDLIQPEFNRPCLIMRKVDGETWDSALRKDETEHQSMADFLARHIPILIMVAQAVAYAHSRGVIHRDLKPSQVMLGSYGEVLLLDWGLALRVGDGPTHPALKGVPEAASWKSIEGTPAYLAPEQASPSKYPLGTHTDIYQLGGILCRLLTGAPPHTKVSLRAEDLEESDSEWRTRLRSKPGMPEELISLVEDCLNPDPAARPESAKEVARRLEEWQGGRARRQQARAKLVEVGQRLASPEEDYDHYNSIVNLMEQSRALWPDQPDFPKFWDHLLVRFAKLALRRDDLNFAESLVGRMMDLTNQTQMRCEVDFAQKQRAERESQRRRWRWMSIAATTIAMVSLIALYVEGRVEQEREAVNQLRSRAWLGARSLETSLNQQEDNLRILADFMAVSDSMTSEAFERFALPMTQRHPGLLSLNWVEEVSDTQRNLAEIRYRSEDSRFPGIREPTPTDQWIPAKSRPVHRVVRYAAPFDPNAITLGLDQNFSPERATTFDQSRDSGQIVVSPRIVLARGHHGEPGKLVVVPAYQSGRPINTTEERRAALMGYAVGVWRLGNIMHSALHDRFPQESTFVLKDPTEQNPILGTFRVSGQSPDPAQTSNRVIQMDREFRFAGKRYIVSLLEWK